MKNWLRPKASIERMFADTAVSACNVTQYYKFKCDAPSGSLHYYPVSDGKIDGVYTGNGRDERLGGFEPCNKLHSTQKVDEYYDGYVRGYLTGKKTNVIVWLERDNHGHISNWHATRKLDMSQWEKQMS